ncbi:uncharacterized protein METZ01_LOCUS349398, partial [marine metagenome]
MRLVLCWYSDLIYAGKCDLNGNADTDALPKNPSFVTDRVVPGPHTVGL